MEQQIILQGIKTETLLNLISENFKAQFLELQKNIINKDVNDNLLTRAETCELLKIDSSTLWHWTNKGKITAYGIGNRRYYKRSELMSSLVELKAKEGIK